MKVRRRELFSAEGDPFTLLNTFHAWKTHNASEEARRRSGRAWSNGAEVPCLCSAVSVCSLRTSFCRCMFMLCQGGPAAWASGTTCVVLCIPTWALICVRCTLCPLYTLCPLCAVVAAQVVPAAGHPAPAPGGDVEAARAVRGHLASAHLIPDPSGEPLGAGVYRGVTDVRPGHARGHGRRGTPGSSQALQAGPLLCDLCEWHSGVMRPPRGQKLDSMARLEQGLGRRAREGRGSATGGGQEGGGEGREEGAEQGESGRYRAGEREQGAEAVRGGGEGLTAAAAAPRAMRRRRAAVGVGASMSS